MSTLASRLVQNLFKTIVEMLKEQAKDLEHLENENRGLQTHITKIKMTLPKKVGPQKANERTGTSS